MTDSKGNKVLVCDNGTGVSRLVALRIDRQKGFLDYRSEFELTPMTQRLERVAPACMLVFCQLAICDYVHRTTPLLRHLSVEQKLQRV